MPSSFRHAWKSMEKVYSLVPASRLSLPIFMCPLTRRLWKALLLPLLLLLLLLLQGVL
jgi:hypothetical protein